MRLFRPGIKYYPLSPIAAVRSARRDWIIIRTAHRRRQRLPPRNGIPVSFVRDPPMDFPGRPDIRSSHATFHSTGLICFQFERSWRRLKAELIVVAISTNQSPSVNQSASDFTCGQRRRNRRQRNFVVCESTADDWTTRVLFANFAATSLARIGIRKKHQCQEPSSMVAYRYVGGLPSMQRVTMHRYFISALSSQFFSLYITQ